MIDARSDARRLAAIGDGIGPDSALQLTTFRITPISFSALTLALLIALPVRTIVRAASIDASPAITLPLAPLLLAALVGATHVVIHGPKTIDDGGVMCFLTNPPLLVATLAGTTVILATIAPIPSLARRRLILATVGGAPFVFTAVPGGAFGDATVTRRFHGRIHRPKGINRFDSLPLFALTPLLGSALDGLATIDTIPIADAGGGGLMLAPITGATILIAPFTVTPLLGRRRGLR